MASILTTGWYPTTSEGPLASYGPYSTEVEENTSPSSRRDGDWAKTRLDLELANVTEGKEALWECVLALWRLKSCEEEGCREEAWQKLVSAWLVSHLRR